VKSVRLVPLEQVEAGMRLASDVCDDNGYPLLSAGTELKDSLLASLARRGVKQVQVEVEEQLTDEERSARREAASRRLDALFRRSGDSPLMGQLRETLLRYRLGGGR
jgi:hypothetical protein